MEYIGENRSQESLGGTMGYDDGLTQDQLAGIEAIAMDMWELYLHASLARVPGAAEKIVFGRFHVMGHINKAVGTVRKQEPRELRALATRPSGTVNTSGYTIGKTCRISREKNWQSSDARS